MKKVLKIICHSQEVLREAIKLGWLPGANYLNLRNIASFSNIGLIDISWINYNFDRHLYAVKKFKPVLTVAQDIFDINKIEEIIREAYILSRYAKFVIVVPKDKRLNNKIEKLIPNRFILGYSVPSRYGCTYLDIRNFRRKVHLLGGRPDLQRTLANNLDVFSFDCNRITIDAKYGYYFDGDKFKKVKNKTYIWCIKNSIKNINKLWQ